MRLTQFTDAELKRRRSLIVRDLVVARGIHDDLREHRIGNLERALEEVNGLIRRRGERRSGR